MRNALEVCVLEVDIFRYIPEADEKPRMQRYKIKDYFRNKMVLDVLEHLKTRDATLSFRRSCREGVCGSDGMNINGRNSLACITQVGEVITKRKLLVIRPLSGMPVIRDLAVDFTQFIENYRRIQPYLTNNEPLPTTERLQSPVEREKLDGLYECILCACCTSACPSYWWNPEKYLGPAALLQAYRFLADSRDTTTNKRLEQLQDPFSVYRCHNIGNCTWVCPKGLNPMKAIGHIKRLLFSRKT